MHVRAGHGDQGVPGGGVALLVWRRRWASAQHGRLPRHLPVRDSGAVRGFQRNFAELSTWFHGMWIKFGAGFRAAREQNWSWVNQSIIAVTHRLTRPVNYTRTIRPSAATSIWSMSASRRERDRAGDIARDRARFIAVMRRERESHRVPMRGTRILFCLMTVASPLAGSIISFGCPSGDRPVHRAAYDARGACVRQLDGAGDRGIADVPVASVFPNSLQAYGTTCRTAVIAGHSSAHPSSGLGSWHRAATQIQLQLHTNQLRNRHVNSLQLQPVLDRIDADFEDSLERLLLCCGSSRSRRCCLAGDCKAAADHLAKDIGRWFFDRVRRRRASAIVARSNGNATAPGRTCCSTSLRRAAGRSAQSLAPSAVRTRRHHPCRRRKIIVARGAEDTRGS